MYFLCVKFKRNEMAIKQHYCKILAYDSEDNYIGSFRVVERDKNEIEEFINLVRLVVLDERSVVRRLDLVSGNHIRFSFVDVRRIVNQRNYKISLL